MYSLYTKLFDYFKKNIFVFIKKLLIFKIILMNLNLIKELEKEF